jgi:short-subunit dehydrogenase
MLVNNAGVATHGELAAAALAARGGGAILNVSSTAAFKPMAGLVVYGATKAFVKELSLGLRLEVAARGWTCAWCSPGRCAPRCWKRPWAGRSPPRPGSAATSSEPVSWTPAPPHRRLSRPDGVEAGQPAGVAWKPQMRP